MTTKTTDRRASQRTLAAATLTALALLAAAGPGIAEPFDLAELPGCLATPGEQDEYQFTHQIEIFLDGKTWYFQDPGLELNFNQQGQAQDMPGHCWQPAPDLNGLPRYIGKHYNTASLMMGGGPGFWSSDAGDHEQLYWVDVIITDWSPQIAIQRAAEGYVHKHELVQAGDGCYHPTKVAWLRHSAMLSFTFDGGPPQFRENGLPFRPRNIPHQVMPGIDHNFPPNYDIAYNPENRCGIERSPR